MVLSFRAPSGHVCRVGQNARDNDVLTFEIARPNDIWMHAENCPGAHVVLAIDDAGRVPSRDALTFAAGLAAKRSKARGPAVHVSVCRVRDVAKPDHASPGQVTLPTHAARLRVQIG